MPPPWGELRKPAPSHLLAHIGRIHAWGAPSGAFWSAALARSVELSQGALLVPQLYLGRYLEPIPAEGKTKQNTTYLENVTICSFILFLSGG